MIERQMKVFVETLLRGMPVVAIFLDRFPFLQGRELGGRAVLVGCADEQHILSTETLALKSRVDVSWKHRACEVPEMLHSVDVRQC